MVETNNLFNILKENEINFYTGVPDSLLKDFCAYITDHSNKENHIISANEGGAIAIATGYHLATGRVPVVYLQNSGLGNCVNPLMSLTDKEVYGIPMLLMIGWRGEPNIKDEPQHIKQGRVQNSLLDRMEIPYIIIDKNTQDLAKSIVLLKQKALKERTPVAIVIRKDTFLPYKLLSIEGNNFELSREQAIDIILSKIPNDSVVISTTGMVSREVFELRELKNQSHEKDFLTVGAMGHCSQIALGISLNTLKLTICLDGDGAVLMHMGSLPIIGQYAKSNFLHIVLNNGAHDSVGGQPTLGFSVSIKEIAFASGYKNVFSINKKEELDQIFNSINLENGPQLIEIKIKKGARKDLGRPTSTPIQNKIALMKYLEK
jgi:phosphonopyruvate decarboxylase